MLTKQIKQGIGIAVFVVVCLLAWGFAPEGTDPAKVGPWYSVLPPLIAVTLALITGRIILSLLAAILISGGFQALYVNAIPGKDPVNGWTVGVKSIIGNVQDTDYQLILSFVVLILAMISVIVASGGLHAVVKALGKYANGPKRTQLMTALMGLAVFIDDYANTMIVGSSMKTLTDKARVSREKLAFLVDATSAPVAGIAIISTWIGYEVGLFADVSRELGIGRDGYSMFFDALGFRFYCILMLGFVFMNVLFGRDFGPMKVAELRARKTGKTFAISSDGSEDEKAKASGFAHAVQDLEPEAQANQNIWSAILPFGALFAVFFVGLWTNGAAALGDQAAALSPLSFADWRAVLGGANSYVILVYCAATGLGAAILFALVIAMITPAQIGHALLRGLKGSIIPMSILIMAWSLKSACDGLHTGTFLVSAVGDGVSPVVFPLVVFVLAGLTSFATGTSWGTMAILIPTAIPIAFQLDGGTYGLVTMICLGAVLDGSIFGDHCSPLSDTTIMSSVASGCDHLQHFRTQMPYALTVGLVALFAGYLPAALGVPSWLGISIGLIAMGLGFIYLSKTGKSVDESVGAAHFEGTGA